MAGALKFDGLPDYSTKDPDRLRIELQRQNAKVRDAFARTERQFEPLPTVVLVSQAEYRAGFFEFVQTDSTNGNISIFLPEITNQDEGKIVEIGRVTASFSVTARAASGQLVQGAASLAVTGVGFRRYRAVFGNWWEQQ